MKHPASTWAWRPALALLHRWVSLLAGLLLVLLGLTGSLMVWQAELDAALNPRWFEPRACTAPARPVAEVMAVLRQHAPAARAALVVAPHTPGAAYQVWERRDPATGWRREHFIDPACGEYLGSRARGAWRLDAAHAVPLLYELHTRLLGGDTGHAVVGAGALVLLGLALSGLALAWPRRSSREAWRRALSVKAGAAPARWWLDLHRAAGLWMLPLLLLMTCTGAALVFNDTARAAVSALLPVQGLPRLPRMAPPAGPASATATAATTAATTAADADQAVAAAQARFPAARWSRVTLPAEPGGLTEIRLLQPGEPRADTGNTRVRVDAAGLVRAAHDPLRAPAGSVVLDWVFPLHSGEALGWAARGLWTLFGLLPALLLGSGLWLWWRRRRALRQAAARGGLPGRQLSGTRA